MNKIYETISKYCYNKLLTNGDVLSYLENRKITKETIERFELGLFPQDLRELYELVEPINLREADIIYNASNSKFKIQDLIFPIKDVYGNYIAIAGRTRLPENQRGKISKYMNSTYPKSQHLFGLDLAKKEILKKKIAYVVEGYFDVITPHQNGIKNVVAVCGKYLSTRQIALLSRYTDNIVLLFDNEEEAQSRAKKIVEKKQYNGISLTAINPFENMEVKDIDEFLTKYTKEDFISILKKERGDYADIEVLW